VLDAVARHPRAATVSVVLTTGTVSVVLAAGGVPAHRPPCTWADLWWADSLTSRRTGRPPRAAPSPRERYLFLARTVLVGRENGSYNVDRARTWLRGSGCLPAAWESAPHRLVPVPLRGVSAGCVGRDRGQAVRVSLPVGVSAGSAGVGGGGHWVGGRGGCRWGVRRGPGWRCCTFILGSRQGRWRHSNVFPPREAEVSRMNVQRGRRCTFIPVPRPRPMDGSA